MADHGNVEYATATGNDYPAHVHSYERFTHFVFVALVHIVNIVLGLAVGGVMGHWGVAVCMWIIAVFGGVAGLITGTKTSSYVAFAICFVIFALTGAA